MITPDWILTLKIKRLIKKRVPGVCNVKVNVSYHSIVKVRIKLKDWVYVDNHNIDVDIEYCMNDKDKTMSISPQ